jgi:protein gp37
MGKTSIEWTDASWNPVTGCREISPGCANCYAARLAATRLKNTPAYKGLAVLNSKTVVTEQSARWTGKIRLLPDRLDEPAHWRKPRRIFVCDMADLFHGGVSKDFIARVWGQMASCQRHTFQVLTKRPDRLRQILSDAKSWEGWITHNGKPPVGYGGNGVIMGNANRWPLPNVWVGTSVENQHFADLRIPELLRTPAAVRFISAEPLLGPINLLRGGLGTWLHWVIAGGESGHTARPMSAEWVRSLRDQCQSAHVPFFFKQWGEYLPSLQERTEPADITIMDLGPPRKVGKRKAGRLLDGKEWSEFPETKG